MPFTSSPRRRRLAIVVLALPLILLACLAVLAHESVQAVSSSNAAALRFDEVRDQAVQLLLAVVDNETGQRGYGLTQKPAFLEPYNHSLQVIPALRKALVDQTAALIAREELAKLLKAVDARLAFSARSVELEKAGRHEENVALVASGLGKNLTDQVRLAEAAFERTLDLLLAEQRQDYLRSARQSEFLSWFVVLLDGAFSGLAAYLFLKLRQKQELLHVCAWSKTVEYEGEWISFEVYLARRFGVNITHGISPAEADKIFDQTQGFKVMMPDDGSRRAG